jgi:ketosteroid isomerase-like protein
MTTRDTVQAYLSALSTGGDWAQYMADDLLFTNLASPTRSVSPKLAFLNATQRFYKSIAGVEVRELLVDGERACAFNRYRIQPANAGAAFDSDVAELFTVRNGRIASLMICFDTAPYPK